MRTRGFLPKIQGKKKVSATAASTCKVFVRRFGWKFETSFLLSLAALENLFLLLRTLEGSFPQEAQNELGVHEQQSRKNSFCWQPIPDNNVCKLKENGKQSLFEKPRLAEDGIVYV